MFAIARQYAANTAKRIVQTDPGKNREGRKIPEKLIPFIAYGIPALTTFLPPAVLYCVNQESPSPALNDSKADKGNTNYIALREPITF